MSTLPPPLKPSHPLDLPEIRTNISSFLSFKDCVACLRVSHAWYQDFIWVVWFSVGPLAGRGYMQLTPEVVAKYGGYIRDATITMDEEFVRLQIPSVNALESVQVDVYDRGEHSGAYLSDLIHRCRGSLRQVSISFEDWVPFDINMLSPWGHYPLSTASSPLGPSLTSVRLDRLCITWEGFSTFLCGSQRLKKLDLATVRFAGNMTEVSTIRSSVERLEASVSQVMEGAPARPTLFDYLPLLKEWTVPTTKGVDLSDLDALFLRQEINRYCPDLKTVQFDFADGPVVSKLLAQVFTGLDKFTLYHTELTSDILLGTLKHQDTLTLVDLTCRRSMNRMFGYASTMLQLIPRSCRQLQVLSIRGYSLGIEELEEGEWMCKNLKELRLGVRGLTGKSEIDACLMRLQDLKNKRHRQDAIQEDVEGTTIADRVIRRLLPWIA